MWKYICPILMGLSAVLEKKTVHFALKTPLVEEHDAATSARCA